MFSRSVMFTSVLVVVFFSTVASSFAQSTKEVNVRSLDNPAFSAFQSSGIVNIGPGFAGVFGVPVAEVPEGTRLVIEYVSVICATPAGTAVNNASVGVTQLFGSGGSVSRQFQIPLRDQGVDAFSGGPNLVGALSTRLYADRGLGAGGIGVTAGAVRSTGMGNTACFFSIDGHLVALSADSLVSNPPATSADGAELQELILPYRGVLQEEALSPPEGTVVKLKTP